MDAVAWLDAAWRLLVFLGILGAGGVAWMLLMGVLSRGLMSIEQWWQERKWKCK